MRNGDRATKIVNDGEDIGYRDVVLQWFQITVAKVMVIIYVKVTVTAKVMLPLTVMVYVMNQDTVMVEVVLAVIVIVTLPIGGRAKPGNRTHQQ